MPSLFSASSRRRFLGARAEETENKKDAKTEKAVDTEFIFGFTAGADVGEIGEREIESGTTAGWGKRAGPYAAVFNQLTLELVPFENFRFEIGVPVAFHRVAGVPGLDDRQQAAFNGVSTEFRYKLLDGERGPFSFTVAAEPHWGRVDETSGEPVDNYGSQFSILVDKELIKDRLFGALNAVYDPEVTRSRVTGDWQRSSTFGLFASVTTQLQDGVFFGAEARYLRTYNGLGPETFAGHALFVGPTMFAKLSKTKAISAAWGVQAGGRAADIPGVLDLTNFTRHQALIRLEHNF